MRLPVGVFSPYTDIKTNLLFFEKGGTTRDVWFYEITPSTGDRFTKTKPIRGSDFEPLRSWWNNRQETNAAWRTSADELRRRGLNFDVPNPRAPDAHIAFSRALETREQAESDLASVRQQIEENLSSGPWPLSPAAGSFLDRLTTLAGRASLTAGIVEDLRLAATLLAAQGHLSDPQPEDEPVEHTISRYLGSARLITDTHTEPGFAIPSRWTWLRFGQIADFGIGRTPSTREPRYWAAAGANGIPWVSIQDMPRRGLVTDTGRRVTDRAAAEVWSRPAVPAGSLLMAFKLSVGKTAILGTDAFHNEAIASFQIDDDILKQYLLWTLPALAQFGEANPAVRGRTLNSKSIAAMWIPIPPREEQERVVSALRWAILLIDDLAYASEQLRGASDRTLKLLGDPRRLASI